MSNLLTLSDIESQIPGAYWSGDELRGGCPVCGNSSSFAATENGKLKLFCHHCDATFEDFLKYFKPGIATDHPGQVRPQAKPKRTNQEAAAIAQKIWNNSKAADTNHPYLLKKGAGAHGARQDQHSNIIVPIRNIYGEITSLQFIDRDGNKKFLKGGEKKGGSYTLNDQAINPEGKVYICEGFATAASVQEATDKTTICALDAGNLLPVAEALRSRYPALELVICGDDDRFKSHNKGREVTPAAALAVGGKVCFPSFKSDEGKPTDFNDLHLSEGLEVVRAQIEAAAVPEAGQEEDESEKEDPYIPNDAKICLPPAMQNIVEVLEECSQTPPDIISLFLTVFIIPFLEGTVLKKSDGDPGRPPRLPATVIGPSGSGKTTPLERLRSLYKDLEGAVDEDNKERIKTIRVLQAKLKKEKDSNKVGTLHAEIDENRPLHKVYQTQTGSRQGLCRALGDGSNPLIILDEIGRFISRADRGGPEADNMDCITELADQGCIRPPLLKGTLEQGPTKTIYGVSFGLYGTTTGEDLPQKKAANLLKGGFFSRQIIGIIDEVKGFPEKNYLTEQELHQFRLWRDGIMDACRDAEYSYILDDSARQVFREYRAKISKKFVISGNSHEHHAGQIIRRVKQSEDICLIFHVSDPESNRNKHITGLTATLATLFVDYFHERHHTKFLRFIEQGEESANRHAIGDRILKYLIENDGSLSIRELYRGLHLRQKVCMQTVQHLHKKGRVSLDSRVVSIC